MNWAVFNRFPRLILAVSVSVWMAGGCLFGCSNMNAMAGEVAQSDAAAVSGESCHSAHSHDCCTKPKSQKHSVNQPAPPSPTTSHSSALTGLPRGLNECPLITNSRAVTSKSSGSVPEPDRVPVAVLPALAEHRKQTEVITSSAYLPNRGPTHLRNCVFLI